MGHCTIRRSYEKKCCLTFLKFIVHHPLRFKEILILKKFRTEREKHGEDTSGNLASAQYTWAQNKMNVSLDYVASIVKYWIFEAPLKYLPECRFPFVSDFFDKLKELNIATAIFSDYPVKEKMKALGLKADLEICSTDTNIDRFKPDPKGLVMISRDLGTPRRGKISYKKQNPEARCFSIIRATHV